MIESLAIYLVALEDLNPYFSYETIEGEQSYISIVIYSKKVHKASIEVLDILDYPNISVIGIDERTLSFTDMYHTNEEVKILIVNKDPEERDTGLIKNWTELI